MSERYMLRYDPTSDSCELSLDGKVLCKIHHNIGAVILCKKLNEYESILEPFRNLCKDYNIRLEDIPEILEEYISLDNEGI